MGLCMVPTPDNSPVPITGSLVQGPTHPSGLDGEDESERGQEHTDEAERWP